MIRATITEQARNAGIRAFKNVPLPQVELDPKTAEVLEFILSGLSRQASMEIVRKQCLNHLRNKYALDEPGNALKDTCIFRFYAAICNVLDVENTLAADRERHRRIVYNY